MKDQLPEADIVILSWNRVESTIETLQNILIQQDVSMHIWVVDQGSDEPVLAELRKFVNANPTIHLTELGHNLGVAGGRNFAMKLGKAGFIVCIDNDAVFESDHAIVKAIQKFQQDENMAVVGFKIVNYFTGALDLTSWSYPRTMLDRQNQKFLTTRFCGAGHAIRRTALEQTEYYDESLFFYWEELDLSYQMINLGYRIWYDPEIIVMHKISSEKKELWNKKRFYYLVRNALYLNWKFNRSIPNLMVQSAGYFLKGLINGLAGSTLRAIGDSYSMILRIKPSRAFILNSGAREYIRQHDGLLRGNFFSRIINEVVTKLPVMK